jgi:hypothetical protein
MSSPETDTFGMPRYCFKRGIGLSISILTVSITVELLMMLRMVVDGLMKMIPRGKTGHQMWSLESGREHSCFNIHFITGRSRL